MIDPNSQFFAILTAVGEAKQANADALGIPWKLTELGVGDANGTDPIPDRKQKKLINERRRRQLNKLSIDPANPNILIAEQIIPADEGGWWIREIGLYDGDGDLVAVANCAPSYKPLMSQGSGRTQVVRMNFIVSSAANVVLMIDPAVVLATRKFVTDSITDAINQQDVKQSVLVATTGPVVLAGAQTIDGVAVPVGSRVLVKDQAQAKDNGLYLTTAEIWTRTADADIGSEVSPGLLVHVERGTANGDALWHLVTDAPIVLGTTPLSFQWAGGQNAPTPPVNDRSKRVANTEFVMRALGNFAGNRSVSQSRALTVEELGMRIELAAGVVATLPSTSSVPEGSIYLLSAGPASTTSQVTVANGDQLALNNFAVSTPYIFSPGGDVIVVREGNVWRGHLGSEPLKTSKMFNASLTTPGYQFLPSGLIEQWGEITTTGVANEPVGVTFPLAFPTACFSFIATASSSPVGYVGGEARGRERGIVTSSATLPQVLYWRALGK
ncbi:phage tail protein [Pseudomonas veronii]|uniref:phage tail protein n=1 Tax=Pseudomonas veronii TaxID=76761 RepID=UPI0015A33217|nr:phage tail protein [Pseudomonas veronii]NWD56288.1 phage tail protein [Pseudomonas veronii]